MSKTISCRRFYKFFVTTVVLCILADIVAYGIVIPVLPNILMGAATRETDVQSSTAAVIAVHAGSSTICFPAAGIAVDAFKTRSKALTVGLLVFIAVRDLQV
jgi:hypothetical protein